MADDTQTSDREKNRDALDALGRDNEVIGGLLDKWSTSTATLTREDSVEVRWERGSTVKLLLQHLAVREEAKVQLAGRLRDEGHGDLADRLEGDGPGRRADISGLDEVARGHQAITLNTPGVDVAVQRLAARLRPELEAEGPDGLLGEIVGVFGRTTDERDLPSARKVRMQGATHPNPYPKWYDKVGILKATRALYDHLRSSPSGATSPGTDSSREHDPR
jgi:hypothetical protein